MNSRISHQLLVLGNGFDITCGLNSRFVQFFRPRMVDIDKNKIIVKRVGYKLSLPRALPPGT